MDSWIKLLIIMWLINFIFISPPVQLSPEICDNALDDDNDGQIDLNDDDCYCEPLEQRIVPTYLLVLEISLLVAQEIAPIGYSLDQQIHQVKINGKKAQIGVYAYSAQVSMTDNKKRMFRGMLTLMR